MFAALWVSLFLSYSHLIYFFWSRCSRPESFLATTHLWAFVVFMVRLKCKKCGSVFEYEYKPLDSLVHLGPYKRITCPVCGKSGWYNVYSSVKDPVTYPPEEKKPEQPEQPLTEEELEKKRIEESKYETS